MNSFVALLGKLPVDIKLCLLWI